MNFPSDKTHLVVDHWGPMKLLRVDTAAVGQELARYLQAASYRTNNKLRRHDSKGWWSEVSAAVYIAALYFFQSYNQVNLQYK